MKILSSFFYFTIVCLSPLFVYTTANKDLLVAVLMIKNEASVIVETLEPQAIDSFFNWNFFDSILGQKEGYSSYVFEDTAAELLKKDPALKKKLEDEKLKNPDLAKNGRAQLDFVYKNSDYYEKTFMRYPIGRMQQDLKLNLK